MMIEDKTSESTNESRLTYSMMALVVAFVFVMTCIVLWITTSLIRNELGRKDQASPTQSLVSTAAASASPSAPPTSTPEQPDEPTKVKSTWTPAPSGGGDYVRFLYWYVQPNQIRLGGCVQINWETENAVSLKLYRNDTIILADAPANNSFQDCPTKIGYNVYRLVAENSVGQSNWIQLQVKVVR